MSQLPHNHDTLKLTSEISAANKHVVQIASPNDEMKLLSSLDTLGYIEFDGLCNLKTLKKMLFTNLELPCLSRNTFHSIGQYKFEGDFLVQCVWHYTL